VGERRKMYINQSVKNTNRLDRIKNLYICIYINVEYMLYIINMLHQYILVFYLVQPAGIFYTLVNVHFWSFAHLTTEIVSLQSCVISAMDSSTHVFVVISNSFLDFHFL